MIGKHLGKDVKEAMAGEHPREIQVADTDLRFVVSIEMKVTVDKLAQV